MLVSSFSKSINDSIMELRNARPLQRRKSETIARSIIVMERSRVELENLGLNNSEEGFSKLLLKIKYFIINRATLSN